MTALTLRSLAARKARTALTAAAVVLGVGADLRHAHPHRDDQPHVRRRLQGGDERVRRRGAGQAGGQGGLRRPAARSRRACSRACAPCRASRPPWATSSPRGSSTTSTASGSPPQAPNFIASAQPKPFDAVQLRRGPPAEPPGRGRARPQDGAGRGLQARRHASQVSGDGPRKRLRARRHRQVREPGVARPAPTPRSSRCPRRSGWPACEGELNEIDVIAEPGREPGRAARPHRPGAAGETSPCAPARSRPTSRPKNIKEGFSFINVALLVFAGIALFVGAFIIFNSFSMTVAQRMRELAMLRTLGASRRQILRSVVLEAALVGLVASVLGVLAGLGLAPGAARPVQGSSALDLPAEGTDVARQRDRHRPDHRHAGHRRRVPVAGAARDARAARSLALREGAVLPPGRSRRLRTPLALRAHRDRPRA